METSGRAWDVPIPVFLKTVLALGVALMIVQDRIAHLASHPGERGRQAPSETIV